ncbi:MAG: DMT family transporter [Cytophagaceae bacterium]|nr:DMT family transporter [Cytophagaceae bacterium]MDW8455255.1 DMT family transporter [Cytophagaceae bacterium]
MTSKNNLRAHGILWGTSMIGALNYTISKIAMPEYISPAAILVVRGFSTIIFFGAISFFILKDRVNLRDMRIFFLCAFFGVVGNQIMFYEGLNLTSAINASLMITGVPVIVFVTSIFTRNEKFSFHKLLGIGIGLAGTVLLIIHSSQQSMKAMYIGDILVLLNSFSWALFLATVRPLLKTYRVVTIVAYMFSIGFIIILPYGYNDFLSVNWEKFTVKAWLSLLFIVVFATWCAYYMNIVVLKYVSASIAGSYTYLQPLLATCIALFWGTEMITTEKILYSALILTGVYIVSIPSEKVRKTFFKNKKKRDKISVNAEFRQ